MKRFDLINLLIENFNYKRYLEIGIKYGDCFDKIKCNVKYSVDPNPLNEAGVKPTYLMPSDKFFHVKDVLHSRQKYDIIFVDGLHHAEQVERDIDNSLRYLNPKGIIICHDMNPQKEEYTITPMPDDATQWHGDCWKAWVKLRATRDDLTMFVVDVDDGCGIIKYGKQEILKLNTVNYKNLTYQMLDLKRDEWLLLVGETAFRKHFINLL